MATGPRLHNIYSRTDDLETLCPKSPDRRRFRSFQQAAKARAFERHAEQVERRRVESPGRPGDHVPNPHWIYCCKSTGGIVKVGVTRQLATRLPSHRTRWADAQMTYHQTWEIWPCTRGEAIHFEQRIHRYLGYRFGVPRRGERETYYAPVEAVAQAVSEHIALFDEPLMGLA